MTDAAAEIPASEKPAKLTPEQKLNRYVDGLRKKNEALTQEKDKLKQQLKGQKGVNTRVKRLPKKPEVPKAEEAPVATEAA